MSVEGRFERAGLVIKAAIAVIAFFPGLAALFGLVPIPEPIQRLVQFISFSLGAAVLIAIPLLDKRIRRARPETVSILTILAILIGSGLAFTYFEIAQSHTVRVSIEDTANPQEGAVAQPREEVLLVPLNPSSEIQEIIAPFRGEYEEPLHNSPRADELRRLMARERGGTALVMVVLLVLTQILMTAPVVAIAWRAAGPARGRGRMTETPPSTTVPGAEAEG